MGRDRVIARDIAAASGREFDLMVVGGGIYGAALLQAAARRGLRACLCEARDFGAGTSWNSLRIVHGGLRYLQTADLPRFFQSVAARRRFARQFPELVRPLECVMPTSRRGLRRAPILRLALLVNDLLGCRRNAGVAEAVHLPRGRMLGRDGARRAFPWAAAAAPDGAACWSDYRMVSSERILVELLHDAVRHGAVALNHAPVVELREAQGVVSGAVVHDALAGGSHEIVAGTVVLCTGPQLRALAQWGGGDVSRLFRPSLAFNLLLDRVLPVDHAFAVNAPEAGAPVLFVVPQAGSLLAGTMHAPRPPGTTEAVPTQVEIAGFLAQLNAAVRGLDAEPRHVRRVFAGLLPVEEAGGTRLRTREIILDHGRAGGVRRLYSVSGVKWTMAGAVAARTLQRIGAGGDAVGDDSELQLSPATGLLTDARRLWTSDAADLRRLLDGVVAEEAVHSLDDLVFRRSNWAATECDLDRVRERVAQILDRPPALMSTGAGR